MLPLTLDRHVRTSPSLMYNDATQRVLEVLRKIVLVPVLVRHADRQVGVPFTAKSPAARTAPKGTTRVPRRRRFVT